ncbi:MAG: PIG-L family deacetylase [Oculatellaceae cyanobacterium Prado106]|jgi:LmbE family N-acetylglucosaminyl deacetylase|nr:PIG-L family deacetylase [Oculatellaceae cyanobacterium Prado106]
MKISALWQKASDYVGRVSFRQKLYRQSQPIAPSTKPTVIFAPHQDDETLGCGGVIALKRQQGVPVKVVFLTDGRECYTGIPEPLPLSIQECIQIRQQEAIAALGTLGVAPSDITFLKYQDSTLWSFEGEQRQAIVTELKDLLVQLNPQEVYAPYRNDMHTDHIETYRLVKDAVDLLDQPIDFWQYLIWSLWRYEHLDDLVQSQFANLYHVAIDSVRQQKNQALRAYRSQYVPIVQNFSVLPKSMLTFFDNSYELFVKVTPDI